MVKLSIVSPAQSVVADPPQVSIQSSTVLPLQIPLKLKFSGKIKI